MKAMPTQTKDFPSHPHSVCAGIEKLSCVYLIYGTWTLSTMIARYLASILALLGCRFAIVQSFDPESAFCQYDHSTLNEKAFDTAYANNATHKLKLVVVVRFEYKHI